MNKYTDDENQIIYERVLDKASYEDIPKELGRTESSVAKQAHRLGIKRVDAAYVNYWGKLNWQPGSFNIHGWAKLQNEVVRKRAVYE